MNSVAAPGEDDELEPDEEREADRGRPAPEPFWVIGDRPATDPQPAQHRGPDVVQRRERVEEVPGRSDQRAHDRHPDPAVDPQEERGDVRVARVAGDPLGDDPDPAKQADPTERVAEPRRRQRPLSIEHGRCRSHVPDDDEDERQGDRRGGPDQVDRQRQPTRVRRVERMRGDGRWQEDRETESPEQALR